MYHSGPETIRCLDFVSYSRSVQPIHNLPSLLTISRALAHVQAWFGIQPNERMVLKRKGSCMIKVINVITGLMEEKVMQMKVCLPGKRILLPYMMANIADSHHQNDGTEASLPRTTCFHQSIMVVALGF